MKNTEGMEKQMTKSISEKVFKKKCLTKFPEFIRVDGIGYKQIAGKTVNDTYEFCYVAFDGNFCNWKIPALLDFHESDYKELLYYIESDLKNIAYEVLHEIVTKATLFRRELTSLLNRYNKEAEAGNTPDYILASYLIMCLNNFSTTTIIRDEWYKK